MIDDAFARRFESIIYFPIPRPEERLRLWQQGFSKQSQLDQALDLEKISHEHTLAGGSIMNVIRYASLEAYAEAKGRIFDLKVKDKKNLAGVVVGDQVEGIYEQVLSLLVLSPAGK